MLLFINIDGSGQNICMSNVREFEINIKRCGNRYTVFKYEIIKVNI